MYKRKEPDILIFLHKHDVIKIGPEQKGNVLRVAQPTMHLTHSVCNIQLLIARYVL